MQFSLAASSFKIVVCLFFLEFCAQYHLKKSILSINMQQCCIIHSRSHLMTQQHSHPVEKLARYPFKSKLQQRIRRHGQFQFWFSPLDVFFSLVFFSQFFRWSRRSHTLVTCFRSRLSIVWTGSRSFWRPDSSGTPRADRPSGDSIRVICLPEGLCAKELCVKELAICLYSFLS